MTERDVNIRDGSFYRTFLEMLPEHCTIASLWQIANIQTCLNSITHAEGQYWYVGGRSSLRRAKKTHRSRAKGKPSGVFFTMSSMSLAELLKVHSKVLTLQANNRIKCNATGHEMPPSAEAVRLHLAGKKFKKACEWYNRDYSQYLPWIIEHKSDRTKLFCTVTRMPLNKIPGEIDKHVLGKKFLRLQKAAEEKQKGLDAKSAKKLARQKEREEAARLGIWMPGADVLGDDASDSEAEDEDGEGGDDMQEDEEQEDGDEEDAMDEGSDDEDWIITSDKLMLMKQHGIREEEHPRLATLSGKNTSKKGIDSSAPKTKNSSGASQKAPAAEKPEKAMGKRTGKPVKEQAMQATEAQPAKKRRG